MPDPADPKTTDESAPASAEVPSAADLDKVVESSVRQKEEKRRKLDREADEREKAEIKALRRPVTISQEETKNLVHKFRSAAEQGDTEYVILTFPAKLLEDFGRAINNFEPDWPDTLAGAPRGYYEVVREEPAARRAQAFWAAERVRSSGGEASRASWMRAQRSAASQRSSRRKL